MASEVEVMSKLAVRYKLVTPEQLADCLRAPISHRGKLGEVMLQRGLISSEQLDWLKKSTAQVMAEAATRAQPTPVAQPAPQPKPQPSPRPSNLAQREREAGSASALLREGVALHASDIHLHAGLPPRVRIHGVLQAMPGHAALTPDETRALVDEVLSPDDRQRFAARNDLDFAHTVPGLGRFRANAYRQQRGFDLVFRVIPPEPPTLEQLGLPATLEKFTTFHQGLVLCTGPAGCGKSSTMAALVDCVNRERADHVLTIEDPIEFVHRSKKCLVRQRQVLTHTESFARALRAALREDPDVIAIGELRDLETIQLALSAAETGHLVLGTLHTNSAIRTINRLLDVFPPAQQAQIRVMFSESLRGVISQRLVRRADGKGRVAALEVLTMTPAVANLIRDSKQFQIRSVMQMGRSHGMRLLEDSLKELVQSGTITAEEARLHSDGPVA